MLRLLARALLVVVIGSALAQAGPSQAEVRQGKTAACSRVGHWKRAWTTLSPSLDDAEGKRGTRRPSPMLWRGGLAAGPRSHWSVGGFPWQESSLDAREAEESGSVPAGWTVTFRIARW